MELNHDVLSLICQAVHNKADLVSLCMTCKLLFVIAEPHLLASVNIPNERALARFLDFLLRDSSKGGWIRHLDIKTSLEFQDELWSGTMEGTTAERVAGAVATVLELASGLTSMELGSAQYFLTMQQVRSAIQSCTCLVHLNFDANSNSGHGMVGVEATLTHLSAPLRRVAISVPPELSVGDHILALLLPFATTLEIVELKIRRY